jgi:cation diffusion facilitator family transporter
MSASGSKKVVIAALVGNGLIAVTKFAAAFYTGSSAMFSEAVHSLVDTSNQALILYGMGRSTRPADEAHPFGYGMELYFWTFIVAVLLFAVGAGVSIYEGVIKIMDPHPIGNVFVNYVVLGLAFIFEAAAWIVAFREFRTRKGQLGFFEAIRESKDPAVFTVLLEDTAATIGLVVAFVGIACAQAFDLPVLDGVASVVIGCILASVSMFLAVECKGLLLGESARSSVVRGIRAIAESRDGILAVNELRTMHLGPEDILVNLSVDFRDGLTSADVEASISNLEREIKESFPQARRVFIEAQSISGHHNSLMPTETS